MLKTFNKMELLQSQAPAKREFFGSSVVRTLKFGNWTFDLRMWTLVVRVWTWKISLDLFGGKGADLDLTWT